MYLLYWLVSPVVYLAVWTSVASSQGSVQGLTVNDFITYYLTLLIVVGIRMSAGSTTPLSVASFLLLVTSGATIIYSLWIVMIAFTFWFVKFDNNVTILQALLEAGRYPATVYPPWLRLIVTFVVPIAVATTVPLQALRGELNGGQIAIFLGVAAASLLVASRVWKAGVRRYSGASS